MSRRSISLYLAVIVLTVISFGAAEAQIGSDCNLVNSATDGAIRVDLALVPGQPAWREDVPVLCNILEAGGVADVGEGDQNALGTSGLVPSDYYSAIDLFMIGGDQNRYGFFNGPARICFVPPADSEYWVVLEDARTAFNSPIDEPARAVEVLDVVPEGLELGLACVDIIRPGTVALLSPLTRDPYTLAADTPDRCAQSTDSNCVDILP